MFHVSDQLRTSGWQVPAYTMPDDATDVAVLRIVVREGFSMDLADSLLDELRKAVAHLQAFPPGAPAAGRRVQPHLSASRHALAAPARRGAGSLGWWVAVLFMVGSFLFALGSFPPYGQTVDPGAVGVTFVAGSVFFTSAAAGQLLQTVREHGDRRLVWACGVQLVGTVLFNLNTVDALLDSLDTERDQPPRLGAGLLRLDRLPGRQPPRLAGRVPRLWWRVGATTPTGGSRR